MKKRGTKEQQEAIRLRIVEFIKKSRGTQKEAADIFGITERSVNRIWAKYKQEGKKSTKSKKRGIKGGIKLTAVQAAEVKRLIKDKMPEQLKLPFGLWTRDAVAEMLSYKYGVSLSRWQVGRYLKSWGYTSQKPIRKAFEQKPKQVKQWLDKSYPAIKKRAIKEEAIIYFGDETGMRSDHQAGKTYAPKGKTPVVKTTGQRFSLNMISAISNRGYLEFMIIDGKFNNEVFLVFLQQLIKYKRQKIFFIVDGHPAHKTKRIKAWLEENKERIEVFFLPPYSPELNPQEYVNQDVKTNIIGKKRAINKQQMKNHVNEFMRKRKNDKQQVKKYFHEKHVRYAA